MVKKFSIFWKSSKNPNKQRKYRYNIPLHMKKNLLSSHLSKELKERYNMRSISVKVGDKIKIMRGSFKNKENKIVDIDRKKYKLYIEGIEATKKDGSKSRIPVDPSNVMVTELNTEDKRRFKRLKK